MVDVGLVFQKMLVLLIMMCIGYAAGKTKVMTAESNHCLSLLINRVTLPCMLLYASVSGEKALTNGQVFLLLALFFAGFALNIAAGMLFRRLLRPGQEHGGIYELLMVFPNSAFIGVPVASAIYGPIAVFCISVLNLPFYVMLYTYGVKLFQSDKKAKIDLRQMCSPLMITSILGMALYLCGVRLPALLTEPMQTIGQISTPGAMMLVGSTLAGVRLKNVLRDWRLPVMALEKLVLLPVLTSLVFGLFVRDEMMLGILILLAAMPSASSASLLAAEYGKDEELAAEGVFLTTIFSVLTIPLMVMLLL